MKKKIRVAWFSAGVSSFVAAYLAKDIDRIIYIDIDDQHPDGIRFVRDCETALGREIEILRSPYGNVRNVVRQFQFIASAYGAKCTDILKRRVRKEWEYAHRDDDITYVWGFDCTETGRALRIGENMNKSHHEFPLIGAQLTKQEAHGICAKLGVKRPVMYDMGYSNNNCVGCVKGGMGYWNKIRVDFPQVFADRARLEREIGFSCVKGVFLDELKPDAGRMSKEILPDCDIFCEMVAMNGGK
jgi:hypothetical protein